MSFICYKLTHDNGFAPNPYFGVITLATCKPAIRRTKQIGDWVAGFASNELVNHSKNQGIKIPCHGLIYLMKIGETITLDTYFNDSRFAEKKPKKNHNDLLKRSGDNIYYMVNGKYRQLPNNSHDDHPSSIEHDANGEKVLIADMSESYYFGRNCLIPDGGWWDGIRFNVSTGRTFYREMDSDLQNILNFIRLSKGFTPGVHGKPCLPIEKEESTHGRSCSK